MEWVLLGTITIIIVVGCSLARSSQEHIDYMNDRIRQDQKWRDKQ